MKKGSPCQRIDRVAAVVPAEELDDDEDPVTRPSRVGITGSWNQTDLGSQGRSGGDCSGVAKKLSARDRHGLLSFQ